MYGTDPHKTFSLIKFKIVSSWYISGIYFIVVVRQVTGCYKEITLYIGKCDSLYLVLVFLGVRMSRDQKDESIKTVV